MIKLETNTNGYVLNVNTDSCNIDYNGEIPQDLFENARFYKFIDNMLIYDEEKKTNEDNANALIDERLSLIDELFKTDYIAIKIAESVATKEEYADILTQRQQARDRINEIDNLLNEG